MILLDEQVRADQRLHLTNWGISFRQIGKELAPAGIKDENIIPFLLTLKRPTLFTHDHGFFERGLVHQRYCIVLLSERDVEAADYIRRFLRHPLFDTSAKRMGTVSRVHYGGIAVWRWRCSTSQRVRWDRAG